MNKAVHLHNKAGRKAFYYFILPLFFICGYCKILAQPSIRWDKTIGGTNYEELNALVKTADGYIIGGSTESLDSLGKPGDYSYNIIIHKIDFNGNTIWQTIFGGDSTDRLWSLVPTQDGGYIGGGYSQSPSGWSKSDSCRGEMDVWVFKLNKEGHLLWENTYGSQDSDELFSILEMPDGKGYLLGCHSQSNSGWEKSADSKGGQDLWLIQIDTTGEVLWDKTIGGNNREQMRKLAWAPDGNVYIAASTNSLPGNGDLGEDNARGSMDFWLLKFDPYGQKLLWNHRYGGNLEDVVYDMLLSSEGDIFLGGRTMSGPAPATNSNNGKEANHFGGESDFWLLKTDKNGRKIKDWGFGGSAHDDLYFIAENILGQIIIGGNSNSTKSGNKASFGHGGFDYWLLGLNKDGAIQWDKSIGGSKNDAPTHIVLCDEGGFVVGGHSESDISFEKTEDSHGKNDLWVTNYCCALSADIEMLGDTTPCNNEPITLDANVAACADCSYKWSTGASSRVIEVQPGTSDTFELMAVNKFGCIARDTIFASVALPPEIEIGVRDTAFFEYESIVIGGNNPELQYKWNTGDTSASIVVRYGGIYALTVTDPSGCTARDWVHIKAVSKDHVWVPNIFTPDFDGQNDIINIYTDKAVRKILHFQIFDRWGTVYFRRENYAPNYETDGWNGTFRGGRVPQGSYTWSTEVEYIDGKREIYTGSILLKR